MIRSFNTVESGNIARPLALRIKNVQGRAKIISISMSLLVKEKVD